MDIQWINVKEKLPLIGRRVMLFDKDGYGVCSGRRMSRHWMLESEVDKYDNSNVTHWAHLPNEPKV